MNHNLLGVIISFIFVFLVILISTFAKLSKKFDAEASRKIVHIGVANYWWFAIYFFDSLFWALIPPVFFVIFNFISVKLNLVKSMERGSTEYGTVFYPVSLLILSVFSFSGLSQPYIGAIAVCCMGYGDGFAAVIGRKFGKHKLKFWGTQKSIEGCLSMFIISFASSAAILSYYNIAFAFVYAILIAAAGTCLEMLTPDGYDNLTVPLGVGLFAYIII
jgi:phytol kinase